MTKTNRRDLLKIGAVAIAGTALGQESAPKKIKIDAYSRTLHWLRKPEEVAEACHQIGNSTIDLTVRTA